MEARSAAVTLARAVAAGAAGGAVFALLFPERTDYAGHYLAGFGGTLLQRVEKAAWSRALEVDGHAVPLSFSADAHAMWIATPLLVLLTWALLRFRVGVQGDES